MSSLATLIIHTVRARPQLFVSLPLRASSNCFSNFFKRSPIPFFSFFRTSRYYKTRIGIRKVKISLGYNLEKKRSCRIIVNL